MSKVQRSLLAITQPDVQSTLPCYRSESAASVAPCASWTATGWPRTLPTSTSRSSWSTRSTRWSVATPTSTGCARASPSTESCVASRPPARSLEVSARDIASTTRSEARDTPPGSETTTRRCAGNDRRYCILVVCNTWQIKSCFIDYSCFPVFLFDRWTTKCRHW